MVTDKSLSPCSLCGTSTTNKEFRIGNKAYCICDTCTILIEHIVRRYTFNLEQRILNLESELR